MESAYIAGKKWRGLIITLCTLATRLTLVIRRLSDVATLLLMYSRDNVIPRYTVYKYDCFSLR